MANTQGWWLMDTSRTSIIQLELVSPGCTRAVMTTPRLARISWMSLDGAVIVITSHRLFASVRHSSLRR